MTTRTPFTAAAIAIVAAACHEANRAHCKSIGDDSQPAWEDAPEWQKSSAVLQVTKILDGEVTSPEQEHESWSAQKTADGWIYGPVKDPEKKEHPCLVPYDQLPPEQREKDGIFFATATAKLAELAGGPAAVVGAEGAESDPEIEAAALSEPPTCDAEDESASEDHAHHAAAVVAKHLESAPAHIEIPETKLPVGTVIEKTPTGFKFVVPERGAIHGHGRSVGGAMLDAKLI